MVMNRILINSTHPEEVRVAHLIDDNLMDYEVESIGRESNKGNIYKAKVTRIKQDLESAFIELGTERQGLLPLKKVMPQYFAEGYDPGQEQNQDILVEGQDLLVQINKEARGESKGPSVTTEFSLPGRYVVLKPTKPTGGVSTAITQDERDDLRAIASKLNIPKGMGWIIRTSARNRSLAEIQDDLDSLVSLWRLIEKKANSEIVASPQLIYKENTLIERILRDKLRDDLDEVVIDDEQTHIESIRIAQEWFPKLAQKIKRHKGRQPLFAHYRAEPKIRTLYDREVRLPSGGRISIDHTEALVAIDVNSYRATQGTNLAETALNTNLEAATEIARQLKLRNIGGLVVVDFIDLPEPEDRRKVEERTREQLSLDRAHTLMSAISTFGLMEIQRQRWRNSLFDSDFEKCEQCGHGYKRSVRSCAMEILRIIEGGCFQEKYAEFEAEVPEEIGTYLLNNKRDYVHQLELATNTSIVVLPIPGLGLQKTQIRGYRQKRSHQQKNVAPQLTVKPWMTQSTKPHANKKDPNVKNEEPLVTRDDITEASQERSRSKRGKRRKASVRQGFWTKLLAFFGRAEPEPKRKRAKKKRTQKRASLHSEKGSKTHHKPQAKKKHKSQSKANEAKQRDKRPSRRRKPRNPDPRKEDTNVVDVHPIQRSDAEMQSSGKQTKKKKGRKRKDKPKTVDSVANQSNQSSERIPSQGKNQRAKPEGSEIETRRQSDKDSRGDNQNRKSGKRSRKGKGRQVVDSEVVESTGPTESSSIEVASHEDREVSTTAERGIEQVGDKQPLDAAANEASPKETKQNPDRGTLNADPPTQTPNTTSPKNNGRQQRDVSPRPVEGTRRAANDPRKRFSQTEKKTETPKVSNESRESANQSNVETQVPDPSLGDSGAEVNRENGDEPDHSNLNPQLVDEIDSDESATTSKRAANDPRMASS